jgi:hypothetical protein
MNNNFLKLGRVMVAVLVAAMLFLVSDCAPASKTSSSTPEKIGVGKLKELERDITIEAEGGTLHYFEKKSWAADKFLRIIEEQDKFISNQIEKFNETYRVNAGNFVVEIDKEEKLSTIKCDIYVEVGTWYDFHWFLSPLGLDFINNYFQRLERALSWEGSLEGIKISILLRFPFKINNCHAHVWPAG